MRKDTRFELVEILEKLPTTPGIETIIREAKAGEFHDYKNQKYVCGKVALVNLLRVEGLNFLATRVINGEFDEVADEEDKNMLRKTAPKSMWKELGL